MIVSEKIIMGKSSTLKIFITLILIVILGLGGVYLQDFMQVEGHKKEVAKLSSLLNVTKKIRNIWFNASLPKDGLKCFRFNRQVTSDFALSCNPEFLKCYLDTHPEVLTDGAITFQMSKGITKKKNDFLFKLTHEDNSWNISLENVCHETYLPKREYAYGEFNKKKIHDRWLWDNLNQEIFVDQFQVSNRDVLRWAKKLEDPLKDKVLNKLKKEKIIAYAPNTSLTLNEMKRYCADQGKQLMSAQIYDAASFFPVDVETTFPQVHVHSGIPWTKKIGKSFLENKNEKYELTQKDCKRSDILGCKKFKFQRLYSSNSTTWMGLHQVLGGSLEVFHNVMHPRRNLKASSYLFARESRWHRLGKRAYWNGVGHLLKDFNWKLDDPDTRETQFGVAFRCMREVSNE